MKEADGGSCGRSVRFAGFTLIELMVTLVIVAILAAVAMPSFLSLINANRLSTSSGNVVSALQLARSEAIKRNVPVSVCGSSDGATCSGGAAWAGWLVVTGGADTVLQNFVAKQPVAISGPQGKITYGPDGTLKTSANVQVVACIPTTHPADNQQSVAPVTATRVAVSKNDGAGACPDA